MRPLATALQSISGEFGRNCLRGRKMIDCNPAAQSIVPALSTLAGALVLAWVFAKGSGPLANGDIMCPFMYRLCG